MSKPFRWDETEYMHPGQPLAVVFPRDTAEVSALVRICAEAADRDRAARRRAPASRVGPSRSKGALTVVMTQMDRILEIDKDDLLVVTQPGILNAALGRAVAEHGLFYPPDPASYEICSIGGNLAENSGGLRCVKYGVTRDYVLGLEVVLADGSVIRTGGTQRQGRHGLRPDAPVRRVGGDARASSPRRPCGCVRCRHPS